MSKRKLISIISLSLSLVLFGCGTKTTTSENNKTENSTSTISSNKDNTSTETASTTLKNDSKEDESTLNKDNKIESSSSNVNTEENPQRQSDIEESSPLSQEEIKKAQDYFNKAENNGFLCSEYSNTKDISLVQLVYIGAGISEEMTEQERTDYKDEIYTDITKIPKKALEELTKNKLNIELTAINGYEEFEKNFYSEKYDCYYLEHGDTNYQAVEFISGEKNDDGTYTFIYNGYSHTTFTQQEFKLKCYINNGVYTIISNMPNN